MARFKALKKVGLTLVSIITIGVSGTVFVKYGVPYIKKKWKKIKDKKTEEKTNNDTE